MRKKFIIFCRLAALTSVIFAFGFFTSIRLQPGTAHGQCQLIEYSGTRTCYLNEAQLASPGCPVGSYLIGIAALCAEGSSGCALPKSGICKYLDPQYVPVNIGNDCY